MSVNQIDVNAVNARSKIKKLYDFQGRGHNIKLYFDGEISDGSTYIVFHHLDGMYSYCTTEKGAPIHINNSVQLEEFKDGYKVV